MRFEGKAGRLFAPVGQSRARLCVGRVGAWWLEVEPQVREVQRLGPLQGRAGEAASASGGALGWRADPFFWLAVSGPEWEVELDEPGGIVWHLLVKIQWQGNDLTFQSIGAAHCAPRTKESRKA